MGPFELIKKYFKKWPKKYDFLGKNRFFSIFFAESIPDPKLWYYYVPKIAIYTVKAAVCLHNFLIDEMPLSGNPKGLADRGDSPDGKWRQQATQLDNVKMMPRGSTRASETAKDIRENIKNWLFGVGAIV